MNHTRRKIDLYILSLGLLFVFLLLLSAQWPDSLAGLTHANDWLTLLYANPVPLVALCLLGYCAVAYLRFDFDLNGATDIPFEITQIDNINYNHLTFLATYVVPLISFNVDNGRHMLVLALLLVAMGVMYIRTDLFYANPSLALLGFHIYRAAGNFKHGEQQGMVLISRHALTAGQKVAYIKLDDNVYYVKKS